MTSVRRLIAEWFKRALLARPMHVSRSFSGDRKVELSPVEVKSHEEMHNSVADSC